MIVLTDPEFSYPTVRRHLPKRIVIKVRTVPSSRRNFARGLGLISIAWLTGCSSAGNSSRPPPYSGQVYDVEQSVIESESPILEEIPYIRRVANGNSESALLDEKEAQLLSERTNASVETGGNHTTIFVAFSEDITELSVRPMTDSSQFRIVRESSDPLLHCDNPRFENMPNIQRIMKEKPERPTRVPDSEVAQLRKEISSDDFHRVYVECDDRYTLLTVTRPA